MRFTVLLVACLGVLFARVARAIDAPPNIVIVLVDDAGYGDGGIHGHPFLKTPAIDQLHRESIVGRCYISRLRGRRCEIPG